jgi:hypothetical protein
MLDRDWTGIWSALMPAWFTVGALVFLGLLATGFDSAGEIAAGVWASVMFVPPFLAMVRDSYRKVSRAWRGPHPEGEVCRVRDGNGPWRETYRGPTRHRRSKGSS